MNGIDLAKIRMMRDVQDENRELKFLLTKLKGNMEHSLAAINTHQRKKFSGQWALFSCVDGKYHCVAVMDERTGEVDDSVMEQVMLIVPLPHHETVEEFQGF